MTYEEIAEAFDKQADALIAALGTNAVKAAGMTNEVVTAALELRVRAEDCRSAARSEARTIASDEFQVHERLKWVAAEERSAAARERLATALESLAKSWGSKEIGPDQVLLHGPRGTEIVK